MILKRNLTFKSAIIIVLVAFNLVLINQLREKRKLIYQAKEHISEISSLKKQTFSYLLQNRMIDTSDSKIKMENPYSKNVLCFVFSFEESCNGCIKNELFNMEQILDLKSDVLCIIDYSDRAAIDFTLKQYGYKDLKYSLLKDLEISFEKKEVRESFYFILNEDGTQTMRFFPEKDINYLTMEYLTYVKENFLTQTY